jgi:hypothetical protein
MHPLFFSIDSGETQILQRPFCNPQSALNASRVRPYLYLICAARSVSGLRVYPSSERRLEAHVLQYECKPFFFAVALAKALRGLASAHTVHSTSSVIYYSFPL